MHKTKLSVNVNKIATIRNSRDKDLPHLVNTALDIVRFGAEGITVHPRPDERHIKRQDVYDLKPKVNVEFNIEGYPSDDFLNLIEDIRPEQVTFVPDPPHVLTSNAGWRLQGNENTLQKCLSVVRDLKLRSSLFVDPFEISIDELKTFKEMGCDRIELYTEKFSDDFASDQEEATTARYAQCAQIASELGLGLNAGHDLNLKNLRALKLAIPKLDEVSIGHALICDALYFGLEKTVQKYLDLLK